MSDKTQDVTILEDDVCLSDLAFLVDITKYLSDLNNEYQASSSFITCLSVSECISAFILKLDLLLKHMEQKQIVSFITLSSRPSSCTGRQSLRSASRGDFVVPHARTAIKQHRAFSIVGPSVWNSLPSEIRSLPQDLSSSFYKLLLFSPGPGLGAPLSSYLEVALYKFHR